MARIVNASDDDDDLPDLATLLRGTGINQEFPSVVVGPNPKENKPRKRILNNQNDNPLLKPFPTNASSRDKSTISPTKRYVKSRQLQSEEEKSTPSLTNSITIQNPHEEKGQSRATSNQRSEEPPGKGARQTKTKARRNLISGRAKDGEAPNLGSRGDDLRKTSMSAPERTARIVQRDRNLEVSLESSTRSLKAAPKQPPDEKMVVETMQIAEAFDSDCLEISRSKRGAQAVSSRGRFDESLESDSDDLSSFIVCDSISLDEEDLVFAMPPPRSVRRLVKGRRPKRSDESDEESFVRRDKVVETRRLSSTPRLARGLEEAFKSSDNEDPPRALPNIQTSRGVPTGALESSQNALALDLENLSLGDSASPSQRLTKAPRQQEFKTPPGTPILKPIKLKSPTKKFSIIPKSPHRPSMDSFWDPEVINEWNDQYSPEKILKTFRRDDDAQKEVAHLFSPRKSPVKQDRMARDSKKAFLEKKHALAESFLIELDDVLTKGQVSRLSASTGGIKIVWSKKLNTTAGRANWKRETIKSTSTQSTVGIVNHRHHASIELAEKVIDDEERLLNVIAHEFCHLANFMISNIKTNPHGKEFKEWAAKCSRHFGDRGIEVTTTHSYEINYKYVWECENCGLEFKRHSKSIDPVKHQCGSCKSKLLQTKPVPRGNPSSGVKKASEYQTFMKENMSKVREENPGSPQKDVLGIVAKRYQEFKMSKLKTVETASTEMGQSTRKKEMMVGDVGVVKNLEKKLIFLDLTSP